MLIHKNVIEVLLARFEGKATVWYKREFFISKKIKMTKELLK